MKNTICIVTLTAMAFGFSSCTNGSYLENDNGLTIVHLKGTPYERGAAYGHLLKEEIHETIANWKEEVGKTFPGDFDPVIDEFFSSTSYRESIERVDPDLLDEVYGMSESSKVDYRTLLAFQLSEELFTALDKEARSRCTAVGQTRTDSTPTILAQNMDPDQFLHGHPIVLHVIPENSTPEQYIFTVPGLLGLAGLNEKGMAVTCMSLSMLNHATNGLPVVSVVRKILSMPGLEQAEAFLGEALLAIPQCYGVGGPDGVRCFECSANQVSEFYPYEEPDILLHTNFSVKNRDFNPRYIDLLRHFGKTIDDPYYCPRFFHAYDLIEAYNRSLDVEKTESILRLPEPGLEPILNHNTLGTLVMELDSDPILYLALGHREGEVFHKLSFH